MTSLYSPYRAIGYVCDGNPFTINRLGEEIFITVTIGKCFQIFRLDKLVACLVSKNAPGEITCAQAIGHDTFVAVGSDIVVFDRANIVRTYSVHADSIAGMVSVGHTLISFDRTNCIRIINTKERALVGEMKLLQAGSITCIVHPATYTNKFVVGFSNGQMELWNFSSRKLLYTFKAHLPYLHKYEEDGSNDGVSPAVSCAEQSPACDVLAIGFSNGLIVLMNMKLDLVLFTFSQKGGPVTSLSFRTDASAEKCPYMASSSADGRVHIWNLGTERSGADNDDEDDMNGQGRASLMRKLQCSLDEAHIGPVSKVEFVQGEPIMVTAGAEDNSLKVWIFDAPDGSARLLRSREGHRGAPSRIRYYGGTTHVSMRDNADAMSCELVSAGTDGTLRLFNTAIEAQNRELSQKPLLKKLGLQRRNERLPQCIGFDFSETRQRDWGNLVTIHRDSSNAYVWKYKHRVATEMVLRQPHWKSNSLKFVEDRRTHATSVALSPCGNFAIVGTRGGDTFKYNLQSGLPRGSFPLSAASTAVLSDIAKKSAIPGNIYHDMKVMLGEQAVSLNKPADDVVALSSSSNLVEQVGHTQEVSGIFVDMLGVTMVTCGYDGIICFWDFNTQELVFKIDIGCPQLLLQGFRDAGFCAVAGQDRIIRLFDMSTQKLSRRFAGGHSREITDLAFSPDGRRLLSSALDSTLRVWDLPTGRCLNWLQFQSPILSMAVSLSGEYLCLAQAEKEGIYMYIDRSLYETVHFWKEPTEPSPVSDSLVLATEGGDGQSSQVYDTEKNEKDGELRDITVVPPQAQVNALEGENRESVEQKGERGTITMSSVPRAYWTSLFNLEAIKQRNRPIAAPAPAPQAPFFLPSVVRAGGSAPSFPTPDEYAKLTAQLQSTSTAAGAKRMSETDEVTDSSKKARLSEAVPSEEAVLKELAGMGSAWADDSTGDWGAGDTVGWSLDTSAVKTVQENGVDEQMLEKKNMSTKNKSNSRIISKRTQLPRCKLAAYLLAEPEVGWATTSSSPVLGYLKKLAPPAVDLELRALYTHDEDEEGRALLQHLLRWLSRHIASGENFEILQAYLHRTLAIYMAMAVKAPVLVHELQQLKKAHAEASNRFRHLVQKNLCLLKIMGNLPIA